MGSKVGFTTNAVLDMRLALLLLIYPSYDTRLCVADPCTRTLLICVIYCVVDLSIYLSYAFKQHCSHRHHIISAISICSSFVSVICVVCSISIHYYDAYRDYHRYYIMYHHGCGYHTASSLWYGRNPHGRQNMVSMHNII